jgi:DNA-binding NarL/FixJ family response regulator
MTDTINILLADDHQIVTDGLRLLLSDEPTVHIKGVASDGAMALEMARLLKVDVILMDVDMPVLNGIEATRAIKKELPHIRIIILTMHDEKGMIQVLLEAGADGYLLKTSNKSELMDAIHRVAVGEQHLSESVQRVLIREDIQPENGPLALLTEREVEILRLIAEGLSNKEIGDRLFISHRTVDTHRTNLMQKLDLHNIAGLVRLAIECGLVR